MNSTLFVVRDSKVARRGVKEHILSVNAEKTSGNVILPSIIDCKSFQHY